MLKLLWAALGLSLFMPPALAYAQSGSQVLPGGCGTASYTGAGIKYPTQDSTGHACVSVSGSLAQSNTYGYDGAAWQRITALLDGSQYALLIDENTSSQLHADLTAAIPAGTNVIGKVTTDQTTPGTTDLTHAASVVSSPTATPTISTSAYTTGYVLATPMSFTGVPTTGIIGNMNATMLSGSFTTGSFDIYLFNANPSNGTYTPNTNFSLNATDAGFMIGVLHLSDCTATITGGAAAQCQALYQTQVYTLAAAGTTLYAIAVVRGTPTFTGTTDIKFTINLVK